jgi:hypothetical protein
MGWARGTDGRIEVGYDIEAECDDEECDVVVDRGVSHICGGMNGDHGCGGYFCGGHLLVARVGRHATQLCETCYLALRGGGGRSGGGRYWDSPRARARRGTVVVLYVGASAGGIALTLGGAFWAGASLLVGAGVVIAKMGRHDLQIDAAERRHDLW